MSHTHPEIYHRLRVAGEPGGGEFRIAKILPGRRDTVIECELRHASFSDPPLYLALSYTWGNPKGKQNKSPCTKYPMSAWPVVINGCMLSITYNLNCALQQIRHEADSRDIWVDALCIDQTQDEEKSEQVKAMGWIYNSAYLTIAWLGEKDEFVDLAFDTIDQLCWAVKVDLLRYCAKEKGLLLSEVSDEVLIAIVEDEMSPTSKKTYSPFRGLDYLRRDQQALNVKIALLETPISFSGSGSPSELALATYGEQSLAEFMVSGNDSLQAYPDFEQCMEALREVFCLRAYWTRRWILQEILHSREIIVCCGDRQYDWSSMPLLIILLLGNTNKEASGIQFYNLVDGDPWWMLGAAFRQITRLEILRTTVNRRSLLDDLAAVYEWECSDPRDVIYALLNICEPTDITIDYRKSPDEIFISATRSIIFSEQSLNVMYLACALSNTETLDPILYAGLPSWVPCYRSKAQSRDITVDYAAGGPLNLPTASPDPQILSLTGVFQGTIKHIEPKLQREDIVWAYVLKLKASFSEALTDTTGLMFWRALLRDKYRLQEKGSWSRIMRFPGIKERFEHDANFSNKSLLPLEGFFLALIDAMTESAFCMTSDGRIGSVSGDVQVGDLIYVARGASFPLLLRQTAYDGSSAAQKRNWSIRTFHKLVGTAYIHGIMDGEALEGIGANIGSEEKVYLV